MRTKEMNPTTTRACCSERVPRLWHREEKLRPSPAVSLNLGEEAESWNTKISRFHRTMRMRGDNSTEKKNMVLYQDQYSVDTDQCMHARKLLKNQEPSPKS